MIRDVQAKWRSLRENVDNLVFRCFVRVGSHRQKIVRDICTGGKIWNAKELVECMGAIISSIYYNNYEYLFTIHPLCWSIFYLLHLAYIKQSINFIEWMNKLMIHMNEDTFSRRHLKKKISMSQVIWILNDREVRGKVDINWRFWSVMWSNELLVFQEACDRTEVISEETFQWWQEGVQRDLWRKHLWTRH